MTPVRTKSKIPAILGLDFVVIAAFYLLVSLTGIFAFDRVTNHSLEELDEILRYESSTLILYKELSSPIFQSLSVKEASVTPDQISTLCNI